jgi:Lipocalin-like domain
VNEPLDLLEPPMAPPDDRVTGYLQCSPGGHMIGFLARADLRQPATSSYTDAERVDIYKGIIAAYASTYRIEGNKVTHHVLTAWQPDWIGSDQIRYFEINDKTLTIKTAPTKVNTLEREIVATLTFVRVE